MHREIQELVQVSPRTPRTPRIDSEGSLTMSAHNAKLSPPHSKSSPPSEQPFIDRGGEAHDSPSKFAFYVHSPGSFYPGHTRPLEPATDVAGGRHNSTADIFGAARGGTELLTSPKARSFASEQTRSAELKAGVSSGVLRGDLQVCSRHTADTCMHGLRESNRSRCSEGPR